MVFNELEFKVQLQTRTHTMETLYILIPVSFILIALSIAIFVWAVKNGQYDDLDGPAHSILYDDDEVLIPDPDDQPVTKVETKKPPQELDR